MSEKITNPFVFSKRNYIFLVAGICIIVIGYVLMSGGRSEDPTKFNPEIFSHRRITLAPIVVVIGYIAIGYAIMYKAKKAGNKQ